MKKVFSFLLLISMLLVFASRVDAAGNWDPTDPMFGINPSYGGSHIGMNGNNSNANCYITVYINQQVADVNCNGSRKTILVSTQDTDNPKNTRYGWWKNGELTVYVDFNKGTIKDQYGNNRNSEKKPLKTNSWATLLGPVYTPGYIRIYDGILFHSVPYYTKSRDNLEVQEYNKLGTPASAGCVRMALKDLIWLYNTIPNKMTVKFTRNDNYKGTIPARVSMKDASGNAINEWPYDGTCYCVNAAGYGSKSYSIAEYKFKTCKQVCKDNGLTLSNQTGNVPPDDYDYNENLTHDDGEICSCTTASGSAVNYKGSEFNGYSCQRFCEIKGYNYGGQGGNIPEDYYVDLGEFEIPLDSLTCRQVIGENMYNLLKVAITIFQAGCVIFALVKGMLIMIPPIISKDYNALQKSFGQLILFGCVLLAALLFRPIISFIGHFADFDTTCITTKIFIGYFL